MVLNEHKSYWKIQRKINKATGGIEEEEDLMVPPREEKIQMGNTSLFGPNGSFIDSASLWQSWAHSSDKSAFSTSPGSNG